MCVWEDSITSVKIVIRFGSIFFFSFYFFYLYFKFSCVRYVSESLGEVVKWRWVNAPEARNKKSLYLSINLVFKLASSLV